VRLTGRLETTPVLKQIKPGQGHFCEAEVWAGDGNLPVRFVGQQAQEIARWRKGCNVVLEGELKHYEWNNGGRGARRRMVVLCRNIRSVQSPEPEMVFGGDRA
jgi:single-stranded DNA-binding protein